MQKEKEEKYMKGKQKKKKRKRRQKKKENIVRERRKSNTLSSYWNRSKIIEKGKEVEGEWRELIYLFI